MSDPASPIRLIDLGPADWRRTQAIYHAVAELMDAATPDTIILTWPRTPYLCLGYHQRFEELLDARACERLGLPVLRRRIGGGTTYLDGDQLFYQCIFHHSRAPSTPQRIYARMLAGPVAALRNLGLNAALHQINELEVDGHRVAGIGGGRVGEAVVVVGNYLFDFDYRRMAAVWAAPWPSFRELAARALREHVMTLKRLGLQTDRQQVKATLVAAFARTLGRPLEPGVLTPAETARTRALERELTAAAWLQLHSQGTPSPMRSLKITARAYIHARELVWGGRRMRASFWVQEGRVREMLVEDLPEKAWRPLAEQWRGVSYDAVPKIK